MTVCKDETAILLHLHQTGVPLKDDEVSCCVTCTKPGWLAVTRTGMSVTLTDHEGTILLESRFPAAGEVRGEPN
jgi:hypothetical protein